MYKRQDAIDHILTKVLDLEDDSVVHKAFAHCSILSPHDLVTMHDVEFETMEYDDSGGVLLPLPKGFAGRLRAFKAFFLYRRDSHDPIGDADWVKLTQAEFNEFRVSGNFVSSPGAASLAGPSVSSSSSYDPVRDFKRGIKRDITVFPSCLLYTSPSPRDA